MGGIKDKKTLSGPNRVSIGAARLQLYVVF